MNKLYQLAYLEIRRIGLIRRYLFFFFFFFFEASKTRFLSCSLQAWFCNAVLVDSPQVRLDSPFSSAARNFGVFFKIIFLYNQLALRHRWINYQLAYLEIRRIGLIRRYLFFFFFEASKTLVFSLVLSRLDIVMLSLLTLLRFVLIKFKESPTSLALNLPTSLLYSTISTAYQPAAEFNAKQLSCASTLSLVQLPNTFLSCFISALLFAVFAQPQVLGYFVPFISSFHRIYDLELSSSLSLRRSSSLCCFKSKLKTHRSSSAYSFVVFFLLVLPTHHL